MRRTPRARKIQRNTQPKEEKMERDEVYLSFLGHFQAAPEYEKKYEEEIRNFYDLDSGNYDYNCDHCDWEYSKFGEPDYDFWVLNNVHVRVWHIEGDVYRICVEYMNGLEAAFVRLKSDGKKETGCCASQPHGSYCRVIETVEEFFALAD